MASKVETVTNEDLTKVQRILNLLDEGNRVIKLGNHENVVLVIGNTGSGKTTFTLHMTGNNKDLVSREVAPDSDEYLIESKDSKISSTILSQSVFPELYVHEETQTAYYDCPGFNDTRSSSIDVVTAYFAHMLIKNVKKIKLVYIANYHALKEGVDRCDFFNMLKQSAHFIKNIEIFKDSIALVVTKVDNRINRKTSALISDSTEINNIAKFLQSAKIAIKSIIEDEAPEKKQFYENGIKLIDIFLTQDNGNYSKIALFRRPDTDGPLSEISLLQDGKILIERVLRNLEFTATVNSNFGYAISYDSKNDIINIIETIKKEIISQGMIIMEKIKEHYKNYEKECGNIHALQENFLSANKVLLNVINIINDESSTLKECLIRFLEGTNSLNIPIPMKNLEEIMRLGKHMSFLQTVSMQNMNITKIEWMKPLNVIGKFMQDSKNWYSFLISLHNTLSQYNIQKNVSQYNINEFKENIKILQQQRATRNVADILHQMYENHIKEEYSISEYHDIKDIEIDEIKLRSLHGVLDASFSDIKSEFNEMSNELILQGYYIKMSEVLTHMEEYQNTSKTIKTLKIFALHTIFIDTDFIKIGSKLCLVIIAPIWEIIGKQQIILDGLPGEEHYYKKAQNGISPTEQNQIGIGLDGDDGSDGLPGNPGGCAGSFLGIGDRFNNGNCLTVTANGGNGGTGQNGGNGGNGADGKDGNLAELSHQSYNPNECQNVSFALVYNTYTYKVRKQGTNGGIGGNGGGGGVGGYGGSAGDIFIYGFSEQPCIKIQSDEGKPGSTGKGGKGGLGGVKGRTCTGLLDSTYILGFTANGGTARDIFYEEYERYCRADAGSDGLIAFPSNQTEIIRPKEVVKIQNPAYIINQYKIYFYEYAHITVNQCAYNFYNTLCNNNNIKELYDTSSFIDEFKRLENLYYSINGDIQFLPYYESLKLRIEDYANSSICTDTADTHKKLLSHLYTAVLSRICNLKKHSDNDLIIHINKYMKLVLKNVEQLQEMWKDIIVTEYNTNYKKAVDSKVEEAVYFIDNHIMQQIDIINKEVNDKIKLLINKTAKLEITSKNQLLIKKKELQTCNLQVVIGTVRKISEMLRFLNYLGFHGVKLISLIEMVSGVFILGNANKQHLTLASESLLHLLYKTKSTIQYYNEKESDILQNQSNSLVDSGVTNNEITELSNKLVCLQHYRKEIDRSILPMLNGISNDIESVKDKLKNTSEVSLTVYKWQVQNTLRNIKPYLAKIASHAMVEENIVNLLERLDDAIDVLIDVYERINVYTQQKTLADYILNISSANPHNISPDDVEHYEALNNLEFIIKSNFVLNQCEKVKSVLKQFIFPFADMYFAEFNLPSSVQNSKNMEELVSHAKYQIKYLQKKLVEYEASIMKHDRYLQNGYFCSNNELVGPFFVWDNEKYKEFIKKLLSGKEVLLKADIRKSCNIYAVKFNHIEILFNMHDPTKQKELDEKLKSFEISLTHMGDSHYKYGEKYYIINSEIQTIQYQLAKHDNGIPVNYNYVYGKLRNSPCMLSPYATWHVKLNTVNETDFNVLEEYGDYVDLELVGQGQYLRPEVKFNNSNLHLYYKEFTFPEATFQINDVYDSLKLQGILS